MNEDKLIEAADRFSCGLRELDKKNVYDNIEVDSARITAFKNGARWQAKQSPWISIDEQFPEDKQPVLCSSQIYGKVVLCWDELSQSWSYPESGEFYCDWDKVDCWMYIPE